jgi:hypothetical protein
MGAHPPRSLSDHPTQLGWTAVFFLVVKVRQNAQKKRGWRKPFWKKMGLKKKFSIFWPQQGTGCHSCNAWRGSITCIARYTLVVSHFLKQWPIVAISCLSLLDVANFITAREVPLPSPNKKEETCVAIHTVSFLCFHHILLLGHISFFRNVEV